MPEVECEIDGNAIWHAHSSVKNTFIQNSYLSCVDLLTAVGNDWSLLPDVLQAGFWIPEA